MSDVATFDPALFEQRLAQLEQVYAEQMARAAAAPRAAPPITIGPFTNVPAPGSPIRSDWPQQISSYFTKLWGYAVPRAIGTQNVTVNGQGGFGITTGFAPIAAFCAGTQDAAPFFMTTTAQNATQVVFRAYAPGGANPANTTIGITFVIFGSTIYP